MIFALAIVGAYVGGSLANNNWNIFKWDFSSGHTWKGIISGALIGASLGKGIVAFKAVGLKTFVKNLVVDNLWQNLISGTINAAYNFENGKGWQNFGYFAAGFIGANFGGSGDVLGAMAGAGVLTVANAVSFGDIDPKAPLMYQLGQKFIGGALSGLAGVSYGNGYKLDKSVFGKFKNYKTQKWLYKGLTYGGQSLASDFAYTDYKYYMKRNFGEFMGMFGSGFINGTMNGFTDKSKFLKPILIAGGAYSEYYYNVAINGYDPFNYGYKGWLKGGVFSLKSIFGSLK